MDEGIIDDLIPYIELPLNPAICMCESIHNLANSINRNNPPLVQQTCLVDDLCVGVNCNVSFPGSHYSTHFFFDPCNDSLLIQEGSNGVINRYNESQVISVPSGPDVTIDIIQYNYSMEISVSNMKEPTNHAFL